MPRIIAEAIERVATTEMRPGAGNMPRGYVTSLYEAAVAHNGGQPPTLSAAEHLVSVAQSGNQRICIVTGAGMAPHWPHGEIDGLLGAASLAHSIRALGSAEIVVLVEERILEPMRQTLIGAGLNPTETEMPGRPWQVLIRSLPLEDDGGAYAEQLFTDGKEVGAVVAVEKAGPNAHGVIHYSTGVECTSAHGKAHYLFDLAQMKGVYRIGIGDGGNEIGFGNIFDVAATTMPQGSACKCPCGGGATTTTTADSLLVGAVSNWAAYGLSAMMALVSKRPELTPTPRGIARMLEGAVRGGAVDGFSAAPILADDGIPLRVHESVAVLMTNIIHAGLTTYESDGH